MKKILLALAGILMVNLLHAQAGISVTPGRLYYKLSTGATGTQMLNVTNPTDRELEVGVSFSDWEYEPSGNNKIVEAGTLPTSCTDWIQVLPASYFLLKPGETKEVQILLNVPPGVDTAIPVHTAMIFFTQLNPGKTTDQNGAAIQVTVRMGVKVYHSFTQDADIALEFADFTSYTDPNNEKVIEVSVENQGKIWAEGKLKWELFNNSTGKKSTLREVEIYTLPKDIRVVKQLLPKDLPKGNYTISAILTYGESDVIKIAELEFSL
jgi:hypothetical protein